MQGSHKSKQAPETSTAQKLPCLSETHVFATTWVRTWGRDIHDTVLHARISFLGRRTFVITGEGVTDATVWALAEATGSLPARGSSAGFGTLTVSP